MEQVSSIILITIVFFCVFLIAALLFIRKWIGVASEKQKVSDELVAWLKQVSERLESSNRHVDQKLTHTVDQFNHRLDKAAETMMGVQKSIGEFSEIGRSMKELQLLLQSPKLRGNLGETLLGELLRQVLPQDCFSLQYTFSSGEKVDAVIRTSHGMVAIDSKFPYTHFRLLMENDGAARAEYEKKFIADVKNHIKAISKKYILVSEGTLDYALMYIPSESIYYQVIQNADLSDFASQQRVVFVSPMSFYAYIKVIFLSLEGQRIQKQAREILRTLSAMKQDYHKVDEAVALLNKHLTNAYNQSSQVVRQTQILGQKIEHTASLQTSDIESNLLE